MKELDTWFHKNNLMMNTEETIAMHFHTKQNRLPVRPQVTFKDMDIVYKAELSFLAIYITGNLKWNTQV
jgi:hypothetical protein